MKSIRILFSGAAPLGADLVATIRKRLHKVGSNAIVSQGAFTHLPRCTITLKHSFSCCFSIWSHRDFADANRVTP